MRVIHTADWHLGNSMHDIDRYDEQQAFLKWLKQEIIESKADTLVVAGDIFDVKNPSNSAKKMYYRFLASLLDTACNNVVVVGGNHDSGDLLDTTKELSDALNIHVVGSISNRKTDEYVFELHDKNGNTTAICAAIPYVNEADLRDYYEEDFEDGTFSDKAYSALYQQVLAEVEKIRDGRDIPVIVTGHMYAAGLEGRYAGKEQEEKTDDGLRQLDIVGNLGKVHSDVFPKEFTYVALGHIHYTTRVAGEDRVRYSGSPFVMGYDEADIKRYVLQVDIDASSEALPEVKYIDVPEYNRYRRIKGTVEEITGQLEKLMGEEAVPPMQVYIELCYKYQDRARLEMKISDMDFPEWLHIVSWNPIIAGNTRNGTLGNYSMKEMRSIKLDEIVRSLVLSRLNIEREGLTEEEIAAEEEKLIAVYLPYFEAARQEAEDARKARDEAEMAKNKEREDKAEADDAARAEKEAQRAEKAARKAADEEAKAKRKAEREAARASKAASKESGTGGRA